MIGIEATRLLAVALAEVSPHGRGAGKCRIFL
jgi:hypothetical protein